MRKIKFAVLLLLSGIYSQPVHSQTNVMRLTLHDAIEIATQQSPEAMMARHRYRGSYWQYRTYEAGFMPMLSLDATLPELNRSISPITQPDGSEAFRERRYMSSDVTLSLSKNIGFTGGQVFMNTSLQRIDIFADTTITSWLSTPFNIGFRQPLFAHNQFRWSRKIEPLRYNEAQRRYVEDFEQVAITTINYFFDLLQAQIRNQIQQLNRNNNDTLFQIAQGRFNMGTIAENELLQAELNFLNSEAALENSALDLQTREFNLKSYLRLPDGIKIELVPPYETSTLLIDTEQAVMEARSNRAAALGFDRRLIEAESDVNKARLDSRFSANLFAIYGLTQSADDLRNVYINPQDQQRVMVGLQVPILDWGLAKGRIKMAESSQELIKTSVEQEQIDFDQEVNLKVRQFNMQQSQMMIAARSDTVALKRYEVTVQRYRIGKIGIIELNLAQTEKDNAALGYIWALHSYWRNYYELRKLTHYDFSTNRQLEFELSNEN
jgi:outer membrane protein TolC